MHARVFTLVRMWRAALGGSIVLLALVCSSASSSSALGGKASEKGPIIILDAKTGKTVREPKGVSCSPIMAIKDGRGGWFVGGTAPRQGDVVACLIRVRSDGSLDQTFKPKLARYQFPSSIARKSSALFVGHRDGVTAFNTSNGIRLWRDTSNGHVTSLALENGSLFAGGSFTRINGRTRTGVAALNPRSGRPTNWRIDLTTNDPPAYATIASDAGIVYIAGSFEKINGIKNAIGVSSSNADSVLKWTPRPLPVDVDSMIVTHGQIFVAGYREGSFHAFDAQTGRMMKWPKRIRGNPSTFAISENNLYLGAETLYNGFDRVGGKRVNDLAAVRLPEGTFLNWRPILGRCVSVNAIAVSANRVLVGGEFGNRTPGCPSTTVSADS